MASNIGKKEIIILAYTPIKYNLVVNLYSLQ